MKFVKTIENKPCWRELSMESLGILGVAWYCHGYGWSRMNEMVLLVLACHMHSLSYGTTRHI